MSEPTTSASRQDVDDILVAAFEGGINYWAESVHPTSWPEGAKYASDVVSRGGTVLIRELAEPGVTPQRWELDLVKMHTGIIHAAEHYKKAVAGFIEDHDANYADVAVQFALFGKLVYG